MTDVAALHVAMMRGLGERPRPLVRPDSLASAVARPQAAAHYENAGLWRQAALLVVGIAKAHAFVDGNKRTALVSAAVFLDMNGVAFADHDLGFATTFVRAVALPDEQAVALIEQYLIASP